MSKVDNVHTAISSRLRPLDLIRQERIEDTPCLSGSVEDIAGVAQFALSPEGRKMMGQLEALDSSKEEAAEVEAPTEE